MKCVIRILAILLVVGSISCKTTGNVDKVKYTRDLKTVPGPEYEYLGNIFLGGQVMSGGGKVLDSSPFGGLSEDHAISKMKGMAEDVGGDFLVIESIRETGYGDQIRYMGVGRVYKLRDSYGKAGKRILSEKGHMVQFVKRMEPGPDYEMVASVKADNGSASGSKGEISAAAESEDETIIVMRNIAADLGGSLLVVDGIEKDDSKKPAMFNGKGRVFKMKK
jgi:hypothetical protein